MAEDATPLCVHVQVTHEQQGHGLGGTYRHKTLQSDEGTLEVRSDPDTSDDLKDDDLGPGCIDIEIDEEAEA